MNPDSSPKGNTTTMNPDPSTTMNPDPSPRGNNNAVIAIVCVVMVVILAWVVVGVALLAYMVGRKKGRVWEAAEHHYDTTTHVRPMAAKEPSASASECGHNVSVP